MNAMTPFDYGGLAIEQSQTIRDAATRIKCRMSRTAQDIIEIGRDLIAVKAEIGHGNFLPWIEAEFGMSEQSARRFIAASEAFGTKSLIVSDLPPTVLYALAAPSTSEDVRDAVIEKASAGEKVTLADVKDLKAKLADKDDKLRTLKTQKQSADAHNSRLIDEVRSKTSECDRLNSKVLHLNEEVRRLNEPGTLTLPVASNQQTPAIDIQPWKACTQTLWDSAPAEARRWIVDFIAERSE